MSIPNKIQDLVGLEPSPIWVVSNLPSPFFEDTTRALA
jgi:hypothetical protein